MQQLFAKIPNMNEILEKLNIADIDLQWQKQIANAYLDQLRNDIKNGIISEVNVECIVQDISQIIVAELSPKLIPVINGTGVVIHTNLGRSIIDETIMDRAVLNLTNYTNLEFDLDLGKRGSRYDIVTERLCRLSGAEDALIVNNNASAVMLILAALAKDREVIVSRGELVEIGGAFRIPEVMKLSGCHLREVGTTNKTHLKDYQEAINENTKMILKVHTSNYKIIGFTEEVSTSELQPISIANDLILYEDLGSGSFELGVHGEDRRMADIVRDCDIVSFSGDKLLGGPQCGIILGKKSLLEPLKKHQLLRALRIDKFSLSILDQMLTEYFKPSDLVNESIKIRSYLTRPQIKIQNDVLMFLETFEELQHSNLIQVSGVEMLSEIGAGSLPTEKLPSFGLRIKFSFGASKALEKLRHFKTPIIARIEDESILIDFRTIELKHHKILFDGISHVGGLNL